MSRDTRNQDGTYDERDSDGRAGPPRGSRSNGGRGPSDPGMRRPGSNGGSGGNGMIRRPYGPSGAGSRGGSRGGDYPPSSDSRGYADDDDYSDEQDQPSRRSRADYRKPTTNHPPVDVAAHARMMAIARRRHAPNAVASATWRAICRAS